MEIAGSPLTTSVSHISTAHNSSAGTSVTVNKPGGGWLNGDLLIAAVTAQGIGTIPNTPSGWTLVNSGTNGILLSVAIFSHVCGASEPASYTFTGAVGTADIAAAIIEYSGTLVASAVDTSSTANGNSATAAWGSVTTANPGEAVVLALGANTATVSSSWPSGYTLEVSDVATVATVYMADAKWIAAQATGSSSVSLSASDNWVAIAVALLPGVPLTTAPAANYDWPAPRAPLLGAIDLRTWLQRFSPAQNAANPTIAQLDWPVPKAPTPVIDLRTWTQRFSPAQGAANPTIAQLDWPVPKAPTPTIDLRTWTQRVSPAQGAATPVVTAQFDWPVPKGPVGAIDLRTWAFSSNPNIFAPIIYPASFGQHDWPVPKGPIGGIDLRTWLQSFSQVQATAAPLRPLDYPNPREPTPSIDLRTWLQSFSQVQAIATPAKFGQGDWPNPRGPLLSIDLRTWLQPLNLPAQVIVVYPAAFGLHDWPVPRGSVTIPQAWTLSINLSLTLQPASPPLMAQIWM